MVRLPLLLGSVFVVAPLAAAQGETAPDALSVEWQGQKLCEKLFEDSQIRGIHPPSATVALIRGPGDATHSTPAIFEKFLEIFDALRCEGGCRDVADAEDGKATVLGLHVHSDLLKALDRFAEHPGNPGDCIDITWCRHSHAACADEVDRAQFQGSSSDSRAAG
jgi:hypothetical protein